MGVQGVLLKTRDIFGPSAFCFSHSLDTSGNSIKLARTILTRYDEWLHSISNIP